MPQNLTPANTYPTLPLACPKDGEPFSFASFVTAVIQPSLDMAGNPLQNPSGATQSTPITKSGTTATVAERVTALSTTTASQTIDSSADVWLLDTPANSITITVKTTSPTPPANCKIRLTVINNAHSVHLDRVAGSAEFVTVMTGTGFAFVDLMFIGGSWRVVACGGDATGASPAVP